MSTHIIEIIEIKEILPHTDPEVTKLEVIKIKGWQTCVRKEEFKVGDRAIYIPPDYLVPVDHPSFSFLKSRAKNGSTQVRIKAMKIRDVISYGLLIPVPEELKDKPVGYNAIEDLGIVRYEPNIEKTTSGVYETPPDLYCPVFDVENYQAYPDTIQPGEMVFISEKLHGSNNRFVYTKNKEGNYQQFVGSRKNWFKEDGKNVYWVAFRQHPDIGRWCMDHPDMILYGEVFGPVQKLKYGAKNNEIFFAAFAVFDNNAWGHFVNFKIAYESVTNGYDIKWAPIIYEGPFNYSLAFGMSIGASVWPGANHIREGIVIVPLIERSDPSVGRVILKMINPDYLSQK